MNDLVTSFQKIPVWDSQYPPVVGHPGEIRKNIGPGMNPSMGIFSMGSSMKNEGYSTEIPEVKGDNIPAIQDVTGGVPLNAFLQLRNCLSN